MKMLNWRNLLNSKYNHLLVAEIIIVTLFPFIQSVQTRFPIISSLLLFAILPALWVVLNKKPFICLLTVGLLTFAYEIVIRYNLISTSDINKHLLAVLSLYSAFYLIAIVILIAKMAATRNITSDTIKGGISIYFLIGLLWTIFYTILLISKPESIKGIENINMDCIYFSFTTLTTLGYGDMTPVSNGAKLLAISEAYVGQIYLAIFVARLVGLFIAQKLQQKQD
jgi:hypothetical protein